MAKAEFAPVTPGEMLQAEFLAAYDLSQNQLAKAIGISPNRIAEIVNNRRRITADTLVISFADDLIVPPLFGRELAEHIPGARHEELAGCGHYGHLEEPEAFNTLMIKFFRSAAHS